jgi:hypothetical protein
MINDGSMKVLQKQPSTTSRFLVFADRFSISSTDQSNSRKNIITPTMEIEFNEQQLC